MSSSPTTASSNSFERPEVSRLRPDCVRALPPVWLRFFGYLSADGLTYLLGFAIYGWLIRILADGQYGQLIVATSIYQVLMVLGALGLDLIGPRLIVEAGGDPLRIVLRGQWIRLSVSLGICAPATAVLAIIYWHHGQGEVAAVIVGGFAMVLARTMDVSYLAVALGMPGALARTRTFGLGLYLALLLLCEPIVIRMVWIIPLLNAMALSVGRIQLSRILRRRAPAEVPALRNQIKTSDIAWQGAKASSGQLLMLAYQTLDVILLARYVSAESVGQYAMVSRLYLFGTAVLTCLLNTFLPELVAVASDSELLPKRLKRFSLASVCLGAVGATLLWTVGPWACETLGHRHLTTARQVAPLYAVLFLTMGICNPCLSILPSLHRGGAYLCGIACSGALVFALDFALMPGWGARGAAVAQLLGAGLLSLVSFAACWRHIVSLKVSLQVSLQPAEIPPPCPSGVVVLP